MVSECLIFHAVADKYTVNVEIKLGSENVPILFFTNFLSSNYKI